jgi:hypothetical protein
VIHTGYSKIPNYKTLSEGYVQGLTREEMFSKFGINGSDSLKKFSRKDAIRLKILKFYMVADTVKDYYSTNQNKRSDEKFIKKLVAKKTGYSEHSCMVTVSSLIDAGLKPEICYVEQEANISMIYEIK